MATALAAAGEHRIARPLKVLVPLIKDDLQHGREAAERAGLPYYQAAGEKLIEAKDQMKHGEFVPWVARNFSISYRQAARYMEYAEKPARLKSDAGGTYHTLSAVLEPDRGSHQPAWHEPVKQVVSHLDLETLNIKRENLKRQEEREAERALALHLIDIGYKVLARELHPDKGGSREAMRRLNAVRDRLKQYA